MSAPTIKDVAEKAGVSTAAVSLFLNKRPGISKATRERIATAVETLGYVPRANGKRAGATQFIGLLVEKLPLPIHADHFYSEITQGMQAEADRLGYHLVLASPSPDALPRVVAEQQVAGVIAVGGGDISDRLLDRLADHAVPLVLVDNQSNRRALDCVVVDNQHGGRLATSHLLELGHRRVAIIQGPPKYKSLYERYLGYRQAFLEADLEPDPSLIQPSISSGLPLKGYREMQQLLQQRDPPTAVFAVSDRTALGALEALREHGLRVPEDISLVGFDNIAPGAHARPALTTVGINKPDMGILAVQHLHALLSGVQQVPHKLVLYTRLIKRASTAAPPAGPLSL